MNIESYQHLCRSLEELRSAGNPYWNAGPATIEFLIRHIEKFPQCRMLEIGTSNGYTALRLVPALSEAGGTITTVESHAGRGALARKHFDKAEVGDRVMLLPGHAPEVFSELTGTFDLVFLDATKYEHASYVEGLMPYLHAGSIIVADNVESHHEAMGAFVRFMQESPRFSAEVLPIETGILVARMR